MWLLAGNFISLSLCVLIHRLGCQPLRSVVRIQYKAHGTVLDKQRCSEMSDSLFSNKERGFHLGKSEVYMCGKKEIRGTSLVVQ